MTTKAFVIQTATTRPVKLGQPFTRWSIRKLTAYLRKVHARVIHIDREALPVLLKRHGITSSAPKPGRSPPTRLRRQARPNRAGHRALPRRVRPAGHPSGSCWVKQGRPDRIPATYHTQ